MERREKGVKHALEVVPLISHISTRANILYKSAKHSQYKRI